MEAQHVIAEPTGRVGHEAGDERALAGAIVAAKKQSASVQTHGRGMEGDETGTGMAAGGHQFYGQTAQQAGPGRLMAGSWKPGRAQTVAPPLLRDVQPRPCPR